MSKNDSKRANQTKKEPYIPRLFDKPIVQEAEAGIPLSMKADVEDLSTPTIWDKEHFGKIYTVDDGKTYTIRLGLHSYSLGIGTMDETAAFVSGIPTTSSDVQRLGAIFFIPEIYPVKFMDMVYLEAEQPFRLEYVLGSARLESNNYSGGLTLSDDAVELIDDEIIIRQNGLEDLIPDYCTFNFDFLSFQVKVIFDAKQTS